MNPGIDLARIRHIKNWIVVLTLLPAAVLLAVGFRKVSAGYFVGGLVVYLNFLGTERAVKAFVERRSKGRFLALLLFVSKLALTMVIIGAVIFLDIVSPVGLVLGISTLLLALMFDFLFFNRNIEGEEES